MKYNIGFECDHEVPTALFKAINGQEIVVTCIPREGEQIRFCGWDVKVTRVCYNFDSILLNHVVLRVTTA